MLRHLLSVLFVASIVAVFAPSMATAQSLADAAPRSPEPRLYTNADLPEQPRISVMGSLALTPPWDEPLGTVPVDWDADGPPPPPPAPPVREADDDRDSWRPPFVIAVPGGAYGQPCLWGKCPDGLPPLRPRPPWGRAVDKPLSPAAPKR